MRRGHRIPALFAALLTAVAACTGPAAPATGGPAADASNASSPVVASPSPTASAMPTIDPQARLDAARKVHGALGSIAAFEVDGTRTFLRSGVADTAGTALEEDTRFRIASVTKPIVAALVLGAVDRGELALDDVVGDLLPGVVRPEPGITIRQLLAHTSGVFDEGNEGDPVADIERLADPAIREEGRTLLARFEAGEAVIAPARLIVALAETHDRYFAPGTGYHYSNANYQLAGMVLEAVTGRSLSELLQSRIVEPLGLRHTTMAPADPDSPELRGYVRSPESATPIDLTDDLTWFGNGASGGIISTPDEVLAMLRAIVVARLFPADLVAEMVEPERGSYGLGLGRYDFRCGTFYGHNGLVDGTHSTAVISPDGTDGAVIALNLSTGSDPGLTAVAESMLCAGP